MSNLLILLFLASLLNKNSITITANNNNYMMYV